MGPNSFVLLGFLQNFHGWELLLIFFFVLLLFGGKKLPDLARGLGQAMREFRKAKNEAEETFREALDTTEAVDKKIESPTKKAGDPATAVASTKE